MAKPHQFGNGPGLLKNSLMVPVFGEPVYEIIIQTNNRGMMKTQITKYPLANPPTQLQIMGMLLDCMNGQFQGMMKSASMLIDPNGKAVPSNGNGEEKENHDGSGGNPGEPIGT